jgi:hypothetical protein
MPRVSRLLDAAALLLASVAAPSIASAQADEIQVYQGGLANPGTFNITVHNNYTPKGALLAGFPGGVVSNHSLNGVPEFAYGATKWLELGLYLPLYTLQESGSFAGDGFKLRALVARPNGDAQKFVYGLGFELGFNAKQWDTNRISSEFRPIVGWHLNRVDLIFNPIFDTSYKGGLKALEFAPSSRFAYNLDKVWAVAVEEYAGFGAVNNLQSGNNASHQLFGVIDHAGKTWDIEVGAGVGLTDAADKFNLKLIVARDLYTRKK